MNLALVNVNKRTTSTILLILISCTLLYVVISNLKCKHFPLESIKMATFDGTSEESDSAKRIRQFAVAKESMKKIYEKDMSFVQSMLEIVADHGK